MFIWHDQLHLKRLLFLFGSGNFKKRKCIFKNRPFVSRYNFTVQTGPNKQSLPPNILLPEPPLEYDLASAKINYVWLFQNEAAGPDKRDLYTSANRWLIPLLRLWEFCFPFAICQADGSLKSLFYSVRHNSANRFSFMIGSCLHHCAG